MNLRQAKKAWKGKFLSPRQTKLLMREYESRVPKHRRGWKQFRKHRRFRQVLKARLNMYYKMRHITVSIKEDQNGRS